MEHIFPPKTIALAANTTGTITWNAPDIAERFPQSIIKRPVAIRFSCTTTTANSVYCGVRYSTLTKDYLVAERKTLFFIPANGTTEVTPASKPALGLLNEGIVSLAVDCIAPAPGNVTISLIIDDDPPPLSSDPGELIGLDSRSNQDYILQNQNTTFNLIAGAGGVVLLTFPVPADKRFIVDMMGVTIPPTPSFPGLVRVRFRAVGTIYYARSFTDRYNEAYLSTLARVVDGGTNVELLGDNTDTTAYDLDVVLFGREIF